MIWQIYGAFILVIDVLGLAFAYKEPVHDSVERRVTLRLVAFFGLGAPVGGHLLGWW